MNIGIYGNSTAIWDGHQEFSFVNKLKDYFSAKIIHTGTAMCSEERILFDLKKTKALDIAIIFHAKPSYVFCPGIDRDIDTLDKKTIVKKLLNGYIELPNKDSNSNTVESSDQEALDLWFKDHNNSEELITGFLAYKKIFFHPDLQQSRYYGALVQLDSYLMLKNIPVVHCIHRPEFYPKWFEFQSGVIERKLHSLRKETRLSSDYQSSVNGINEEGNKIIFNTLVPLIDAARSKVVIR